MTETADKLPVLQMFVLGLQCQFRRTKQANNGDRTGEKKKADPLHYGHLV